MGGNATPTPSTTISMANINSALGNSAGTTISFNNADVRFLSNQDSGSVSMSNMRNKFYGFASGTVEYGESWDKSTHYQYYGFYPSVGIFNASNANAFFTQVVNGVIDRNILYADASNNYPTPYFPSNMGSSYTFRLKITHAGSSTIYVQNTPAGYWSITSDQWYFELNQYSDPAHVANWFPAAWTGSAVTVQIAST